MEIKNAVALVTGGASGLGEATVRRIVAEGGKVAILDMVEEAGNKIAAELGNDVIFIKTDVTSAEDVQKAVDKIVEVFGAINIVVNCAGVATPGKILGKKGPLPLEVFNKVIQINLVGTFNVCRLAVEKMAQNTPNEDGERGVIINTASAAAFDGQIGQPAYSSSKSGVVGMTLPMARELAEHGIRVVTIAPGIMETPMLAGLPPAAQESLGKMVPFPPRLGRPSEFACLVKAIVEICLLNGETIRSDGAIRMATK